MALKLGSPMPTVQTSTQVSAVTSAALKKTGTQKLYPPAGGGQIVMPKSTPSVLKPAATNITNYSTFYEGPDPLTTNKNFQKLSEEGISVYRPEIIAVTRFEPAYIDLSNVSFGYSSAKGSDYLKNYTQLRSQVFDNELTGVGKLLRVQIWARDLVAENIINLVATLKKYPELSDALEKRQEEYITAIQDAQDDVAFLYGLLIKLEQLRRALDVKYALVADVASIGAIKNADGYYNYSPQHVFSKHLGFEASNVAAFSNTKILMQALFDLKRIISRHSYTLFGSTLAQRKSDKDSTSINRAIDTLASDSKFSIGNFGSPIAPIQNATNYQYHRNYVSVLPPTNTDRAKLLMTSLSKEMRVSKALGDDDTMKSIAAKYPGLSDIGDPFSTIIGTVGNSIFDKPAGADQALVSVTQLGLDENTMLLPYEAKYISNETSTSTEKKSLYVPGAQYYVDQILATEQKFDTTALQSYIKKLDKNVNSAKVAIGKLLQLSDFVSSPGDFFNTKLTSKATAVAAIQVLNDNIRAITETAGSAMDATKDPVGAKEGSQLNYVQTMGGGSTPQSKDPVYKYYSYSEISMMLTALLVSAQTNQPLKNALFKYMLVMGVYSTQKGSKKGSFFDDLATFDEIGVASNIEAELKNAIDGVVNTLIDQSNIPSNSQANKKTTFQYDDAYAAEPYAVTVYDKNKIKWLLASTATQALSSSLGFYRTWMQKYFTILSLYNDILNYSNGKNGQVTRYNALSQSTFALTLFEAIAALIADNVPVFYVKGAKKDTIRMVLDKKKMADIGDVMSVIMTRIQGGSPNTQIKISQSGFQNAKFLEILSIYEAIAAEDDAIIDILQMFDVLNKNVQAAAIQIIDGFKPGSDNETRYNELQQLSSAVGIQLNTAQVVLSKSMLSEIEERIGDALKAGRLSPQFQAVKKNAGIPNTKYDEMLFMNDDRVKPGIQNALFNMLRLPKYRTALEGKLKILTVGIPAGFSDNLARTIDATKSDFSIARKQDDVVTVDIYKRDEQYDGIIFKPITRLFELTRFVSLTSDPPVAFGEKFETTIQKLKFRDFSFDIRTTSNEYSHGISELLGSSEYNFLTGQQRLQLAQNHVESALLELYTRFLTGMTINESVMVVNANKLLDKKLEASGFMNNIASKYVSKATGKAIDITSLLGGNIFDADAALVALYDDFDKTTASLELDGVDGPLREKLTEDLKTFIALFNSNTVLSDGDIERQRIITPKLFERVLHMSIDSYDFEIDKDASDKSMFDTLISTGVIEQRIVKSVIPGNSADTTKYYMTFRSPGLGHVSFEKFFVSISTTKNSRIAASSEDFGDVEILATPEDTKKSTSKKGKLTFLKS